MFLAVGYTPIFPCAPRPLGAAYISILLSEVEQEQRPSGNGDREAIVVGAGLCDGEGERAYIVYDPIVGGGKYLKNFKRFAGAKNLATTEQFDLNTFDPFSISLFAHTKIRSKITPPSRVICSFKLLLPRFVFCLRIMPHRHSYNFWTSLVFEKMLHHFLGAIIYICTS